MPIWGVIVLSLITLLLGFYIRVFYDEDKKRDERKKILIELYHESEDMKVQVMNNLEEVKKLNYPNPDHNVVFTGGFKVGYLNDFMKNHRIKFSFKEDLRKYFEIIKNGVWNNSDVISAGVRSLKKYQIEDLITLVDKYQDLISTARKNSYDFNFETTKLKLYA